MNLQYANEELRDKTPDEIVNWAVSLGEKTIVTTNFGPHEAVILHIIYKIKNDMDVIWIDSGYNTRATYIFAEKNYKTF
mgnify:FL=1